MKANDIRHLRALEKTKKIIKNAENGRSLGLSNDCPLFGGILEYLRNILIDMRI